MEVPWAPKRRSLRGPGGPLRRGPKGSTGDEGSLRVPWGTLRRGPKLPMGIEGPWGGA